MWIADGWNDYEVIDCSGGEKLELHYDQPRGKGVLYQPFEGICNNVERRYKETQSDASKRELEELMAELDGRELVNRI